MDDAFKGFYTSIDRVGNKLLFCGYKEEENGEYKRVRQDVPFKPTLFIPTNENSIYKTLDGQNVEPRRYGKGNKGGMFDATKDIKQYSNMSNAKIYGNERYINQYIGQKFPIPKDGSDPLLQITDKLKKINVTTLDIEVKSDEGFPDPIEAKHPITAIALKRSTEEFYHVWACGDWSKENSVLGKVKHRIHYVKCYGERDLLENFVKEWRNNFPDVITGWNSRLFDMTYIIERLSRVFSKDHPPSLERYYNQKDGKYYFSLQELRDRNIKIGSTAKALSPFFDIQKFKRSPDINQHCLNYERIPLGPKDQLAIQIYGIQQLDYLDVFKKYGYTYGPQESYKLDNIANVVLKQKKLDYSEYTSLNDLYDKNHQKFIDYNIRDVEVVERIEERTGLLDLAMTVAYTSRTNFKDAFGSVGMWDSMIYNDLKKRNIVVPPRKVGIKDRQIEGAHVKDPIKGMQEWVMSFDLNSLYPHIIMQYNMSPETIVDKIQGVTVDKLLEHGFDIPKNCCMTATGQLFRTDVKGFIPEMIQKLYDGRVLAKKKQQEALAELEDPKVNYLIKEIQKLEDDGEEGQSNDTPNQNDSARHQKLVKYENELDRLTKGTDPRKVAATYGNQQMAIKILMNSLYGAMSNNYFKYYDQRIAEGITVTGQYTIRNAEKTINEWMNKKMNTIDIDYVIAIDTDSLYINFGPYVKKYFSNSLTKEAITDELEVLATNEVEKIIEESYENLRQRTNCKEQLMTMKREVIANKGIWTAKKHYMLSVLSEESVKYAKPKIKMMGIEAVRSSTPQVIRDEIKDTIRTIMTGTEKDVQEYITRAREKFLKLKPEDIAFPRGVSNIDKYRDSSRIYKKSTPIHVRGALLYNHFVKELGLEKKYEMIFSGDKIKFLYLKLPNRVKENVIAFAGILPEEFLLGTSYIDYETQFNKSYVEPIQTILDSVGWQTKRRATLEDFF